MLFLLDCFGYAQQVEAEHIDGGREVADAVHATLFADVDVSAKSRSVYSRSPYEVEKTKEASLA
ncbi:hypothetical protein BJB45_15965 [Halomonas huangheensis]|uniref:Uncharacterized protein n=1 Tax=Halomonas huangheensis TaxID=1178482 RepID=W1NCV5_9GAMM|nr:hypothetical protein AR456_10710 [Halomonas huangheensis]ERL52775.1 hypothetical protein BJB45_15965 [Halomonas huangheensis]